MKPRTGVVAVITSNVSPASGATIRCTRPGVTSGTVMLDWPESEMLRTTDKGFVGVSIASEKVSVQFGSPLRSSLVSDGICGRFNRIRIAWPLSNGTCFTWAMTAPPLFGIDVTSIGFLESTPSHTVSERRNKAAGVVAAKRNVRCSPSLSRKAFTEGIPSAGGVWGADSDMAGGGFGGARGGGGGGLPAWRAA